MSSMVQRWEYAVVPLSPVHIDSGKTLNGHEFTIENGWLTRYDITMLLEILEDREDLLDRYVEGGLRAVVGLLSQDELSRCIIYRTQIDSTPKQVREYLADGLSRVYLPGSSLKGAIRTALAWSYLQEGHAEELQEVALQGTERKWAGQPLLKRILGESTNLDLLRALRVFDSTPLSRDCLTVVEVKVAVLEKGQLLWFAGPRRSKQRDLKRGVSTFLECIDPTAAPMGIRVVIETDAFLLDGTTEQAKKHPSDPPRQLKFERKRELLSDWQQRCNQFAIHVAEGEIDFAENAGLSSYKEFHEQRLKEIEACPNAVFLILGWGGGWRTKTVTEAFSEETIREVRKKFGLEAHRIHRICGTRVHSDHQQRGKYFCPHCKQGGLRESETDWWIAIPYPKTRKIVVEKGQPTRPLGWVRLDLLKD